MIVDPSPQGSPEWFKARSGIPTASNFSKIVTSKGLASDQKTNYMHVLLAEWLAGRSFDEDLKSRWVTRGNEMEAEARAFYQMRTQNRVEEVGLVFLNEGKMVGASPDGLVGDDGTLEIKCPKHSTHVNYLLKGVVPTTYIPQIQGQLWVTGRDWADFISYHPDFEPLIIRVQRDEMYIAKISAAVGKFNQTMLEKRAQLKGES